MQLFFEQSYKSQSRLAQLRGKRRADCAGVQTVLFRAEKAGPEQRGVLCGPDFQSRSDSVPNHLFVQAASRQESASQKDDGVIRMPDVRMQDGVGQMRGVVLQDFGAKGVALLRQAEHKGSQRGDVGRTVPVCVADDFLPGKPERKGRSGWISPFC